MRIQLFPIFVPLLLALFTTTAVTRVCAEEEREERPQRWKQQLSDALKGADRLVVTKEKPAAGEIPVLWQIRGRKPIEGFLAALEIDDGRSGPIDGCNGEPHLLFFAGEDEVAAVSWHHGKRIRWRGGKWPGDAALSAASQQKLPRWFADNGFRELQLARDRDLERARQRTAQARLFTSFFPEAGRQILLEKRKLSFREFAEFDRAAGKRLAEAVGDPVTLAVASCQALGVSTTSWSSTGSRERRVITAMDGIDGDDFTAALEQIVKLDKSQYGLLGAARLYFRERTAESLSEQQRAKWSPVLAKAVVEHGDAGSQSRLIRYLANRKNQATRDFLNDVAAGKIGPDMHTSYREEPDLRPNAVLSLARLGDPRAAALAREQLKQAIAPQNRAALEVSLALAGDPTFLRAEQFELQSYSIGYGALDAIERLKGAYGMEFIVAGRHPWAQIREDMIRRFERITGERVSVEGRGRIASRERMQAWWRKHGEEFARQQRAEAPR